MYHTQLVLVQQLPYWLFSITNCLLLQWHQCTLQLSLHLHRCTYKHSWHHHDTTPPSLISKNSHTTSNNQVVSYIQLYSSSYVLCRFVYVTMLHYVSAHVFLLLMRPVNAFPTFMTVHLFHCLNCCMYCIHRPHTLPSL